MIDFTNICQECLREFNEYNQIYIMSNNRGAEMTICHVCRHHYDWTGWHDDEEN
jgi:hypothetical protein